MRVLVTGGCGFLGSALVRTLGKRDFEIAVLDRPGADRKALQGLNVQSFEADIRDEKRVLEAVRGCRWVFHTAAVLSFWRRQQRRQWEVNVGGTEAVMRACLACGVERVIHTSSVNALGHPSGPGQEGDEETPFNWAPCHIGYMDSKHASQSLVLDLARDRGLPAVVVNPGTVFGSGPVAGTNSELYIISIASGRLRTYLEGGANFVGLEDVVSGHIRAAEAGRVGQKYILGGENLLYRDLFAKIARLAGVRPPRRGIPYLPALILSYFLVAAAAATGREPVITPEVVKAGRRRLFYSSDKARRELGYAPRPFDEVLKDAVDFLRSQGRI